MERSAATSSLAESLIRQSVRPPPTEGGDATFRGTGCCKLSSSKPSSDPDAVLKHVKKKLEANNPKAALELICAYMA